MFIAGLLSGWLITDFSRAEPEPNVREVIREVEVEVQRLVEVEKVVTEYVEVEVLKVLTVQTEVEVEKVVIERAYLQPHFFQSLEQLKDFLEYYRANKRYPFMADGKYPLNHIQNNCMMMAWDLQRMAAEQGFDFPTETLTQQQMYEVYGVWYDRPHRVNKAWIPAENSEWYYDHNTDYLWRAW